MELAAPALLHEPLAALARVRCRARRRFCRASRRAPPDPELADEPAQLRALLPTVAPVRAAAGACGMRLAVLRLRLARWQCSEPLLVRRGRAGVCVGARRGVGRLRAGVQSPLVERLGGAVLRLGVL
jgi:hypothetical protein